MKLSRLFCLSLLIINVSCTRKPQQSVVKIELPKATSNKTKENLVHAQSQIWGLSDPSTIGEIDCYMLLVGSEDGTLIGNTCTDTSSVVAANFGIASGLKGAGETLEVVVSSGEKRSLFLVGFKSATAVCPAYDSATFSRAQLSHPHIISRTTKDLGPGEVSVDMTASLTGSTKIDTCVGPLFAGDWLAPAVPVTIPSLAQSVVTASGSALTAGGTSSVTLQAKTAGGVNITTGGLFVSFATTGGTSGGTFSAVVDNGDGTYSSTFTATTAGTPSTIVGGINGSDLTSTAPSITVSPSAFSATASTVSLSASSIERGNTAIVTLLAKDAFGNLLGVGGATTAFSISGGTSSGTFGSVTDVGNGTYTVVFTSTTAGTATTVQATYNSVSITSALPTLTVTLPPTSLSQSVVSVSQSTIAAGSTSVVTLTAKDSLGVNIGVGGAAVVFSLGSGSANGTLSAVTDNSNGTYTATFTGQQSGSPRTINTTIGGSLITSTAPTITVTPGTPTALAISGANTLVLGSCSSAYSISSIDFYGNPSPVTSNTVINLADGGSGGTFFLDPTCSSQVTTRTIFSGGLSVNFYYRNYVPGTKTLTGTDNAAILTQATKTVTLNSITGWIGAYAEIIWNQVSGLAGGTKIENSFNVPMGIYKDGTWLYVVDNYERIQRFSLTNGSYGGWIGAVENRPTGGDSGCTSLNLGQFTNGWCTGGTARQLSGPTMNGYFSDVRAITGDGTYLYVADTGGDRISRYVASTGVFAGWVGKVGGTGGGTNCSSTNSPTTGWCMAGLVSAGSGMAAGVIDAPVAIQEMGGKVFLGMNGRISKYDASTGAFEGWIGRVATVGTGSCATINVAATGWCMDGGANTGNGLGQFGFVRALTSYGAYLYAADASGKISRINPTTGASDAFVGSQNSSTACGAVGPVAAWCSVDVLTTSTSTMGGYNNPFAIATDGTWMVVYEANNPRISRFNLSTGAPGGWIGEIWGVPTSPAACSSSISGAITPTWCVGGTSRFGIQEGAYATSIDTPGFVIDGSDFLFSDSGNSRITRVNIGTGAYQNWIGSRSNQQSTWTQTPSQILTSTPLAYGFKNYNPNMSGGALSLDPSGSSLFATDIGNSNLKKFDHLNGNFLGWVGMMDILKPTGGASGCTSLIMGGITPGWCIGGSSQYASTIGSFNSDSPRSVSTYGGYVYVANTQSHRIERFLVSTGAYEGWIGRVSTVGGTGCSTPSAPTTGWCMGGTSTFGSLNKEFSNPISVYADASGLYVGDTGARWIQKFNLDGSYVGWVGVVQTTPSGGASGCMSATTNTMTPGWCTGGAASSTTTLGGSVQNVSSMTGDGTYIYVASSGLGKIVRFNASTGAYSGWIGRAANAACSPITAGQTTVAWCTAGYATFNGSGNFVPGQFINKYFSIAVHNGELYATDQGFNVLYRYNASTGAFYGWKGTMSGNTATTGEAGCLATSPDNFTGGWCTSGAPKIGSNVGFAAPTGVAVNENFIYVMDTMNGRITRIPR